MYITSREHDYSSSGNDKLLAPVTIAYQGLFSPDHRYCFYLAIENTLLLMFLLTPYNINVMKKLTLFLAGLINYIL